MKVPSRQNDNSAIKKNDSLETDREREESKEKERYRQEQENIQQLQRQFACQCNILPHDSNLKQFRE